MIQRFFFRELDCEFILLDLFFIVWLNLFWSKIDKKVCWLYGGYFPYYGGISSQRSGVGIEIEFVRVGALKGNIGIHLEQL